MKCWATEEYMEALRLYREGHRQVDLAKKYGVSKERARTIIRTALRIERRPEPTNTFRGLSYRVENIFRANGIHTVEGVRRLLNLGQLENLYTLGPRTKSEVVAWLAKQPE